MPPRPVPLLADGLDRWQLGAELLVRSSPAAALRIRAGVFFTTANSSLANRWRRRPAQGSTRHRGRAPARCPRTPRATRRSRLPADRSRSSTKRDSSTRASSGESCLPRQLGQVGGHLVARAGGERARLRVEGVVHVQHRRQKRRHRHQAARVVDTVLDLVAFDRRGVAIAEALECVQGLRLLAGLRESRPTRAAGRAESGARAPCEYFAGGSGDRER